MSTFLYILLGLGILIIILAIIAPKSYEVSRSITINKGLAKLKSVLENQ